MTSLADLGEIAKSIRLPDGSIVRFRSIRRTPGAPPPELRLGGYATRRANDIVEARRKGEVVGDMLVHRGYGTNASTDRKMRGKVQMVHVKPEFRRKKVATGMWHHAKNVGINPKHSLLQSDEGRLWAQAVGD